VCVCNACVCTHTCMYTSIHIYLYTYHLVESPIKECAHTECVCVCVCVYARMYVYIYTHIHIYIHISLGRASNRRAKHTQNVCVCVRVCVRIHVCTHLFDFNVSYSSCWGYSLINTLKLNKTHLYTYEYTYISPAERPIKERGVHRMFVCVYVCM